MNIELVLEISGFLWVL